ncbi:MAG: hypothetical protein M5U09_13010 [Gammaproteobacteria bacterium]|nr:hypothetical protein [Gammaproteobacteria bacterium]
MTTKRLAGLYLLIVPLVAFGAASITHRHDSPYAGQQHREIKSLSGEDIAELRRGGGWGLAKSAELNGMPGPAHLLELRDEIALLPQQVAAVTAVFDEMRAEAIDRGETLIALEAELERGFRERGISVGELRDLLGQIGTAYADLRYVHLSAHLAMTDIVTAEQVAKYNELRGYGVAEPCHAVPEGHDPAMWRKHNGCE